MSLLTDRPRRHSYATGKSTSPKAVKRRSRSIHGSHDTMADSNDGSRTSTTSRSRTMTSDNRNESPDTELTDIAAPDSPFSPKHPKMLPPSPDDAWDVLDAMQNDLDAMQDADLDAASLWSDTAERRDSANTDYSRKDSAETTPTPTVFGPSSQHQVERPATKGRLRISHEKLDRLLKALADSPMLQMLVRRQWWDDHPSTDGVDTGQAQSRPAESETPSLTAGSSESSSFSQDNDKALAEQISPPIAQKLLEEGFALAFPDHAYTKRPAAATGVKFGGIALADPKIRGSPIRAVTKGYQLGSKLLRVGQCSFLTMAYGTSVDATLRVEPPSRANPTSHIIVQIINQVLDRRSGRKVRLLVAEVDMTESFTKAVLAELAAHKNLAPGDIELTEKDDDDDDENNSSNYSNNHSSGSSIPPKPRSSPDDHDLERKHDNIPNEDIDWCLLASEFHSTSINHSPNPKTPSYLSTLTSAFSHLDPETCTMQTLTLASELERVKSQHQDFYVVRATGTHANGVPSGMRVPYVSQHLEQMIQHGGRRMARSAALFREDLVAAVTRHAAGGTSATARISWVGERKTVYCVPMMEGADEMEIEGVSEGDAAPPAAPPRAWVCFVRGFNQVWLRSLMARRGRA